MKSYNHQTKKIFALLLLLNSFLPAQGYVCAVGGGSEDYSDWSDAPYGWIVEKSNYGKIAVLSYSEQDNWIPDYFKWLGAVEAVNVYIPNKTIADQQSTFDEIISAQAVFIKGGDQWKYISYWKGTKTEEAIKSVFQNGGVISGTSAGAMVLSDYVFSAKNGSAYPEESLLNPFNTRVAIEDQFLDFVPGVIIDTHFIQRGRWGRLIPFVFNVFVTKSENVMGIGIDDMTALCIDSDGISTVMGSGAVAFYQIDDKTNIEYSSPQYTFENLKCDQLVAGWQFDLINWRIHFIPESAQPLNYIAEIQNPLTDIVVTGTDDIPKNISNVFDEYFSPGDIVGLIYNPSFFQYLNPITDYLTAHAGSFELIEISGSTINLAETAGKINAADKFLVTGNNLSEVSMLNQAETYGGNSFLQKINSGSPVYLIGRAGKTAGDFFVYNNDTDPDAAFKGLMKTDKGLNLFGDFIFQPEIFGDDDFYENRSAAVLWGLMHHRKRIGLYLNSDDYAWINSTDRSITVSGEMPVAIIDARETTFVDSSVYKYSSSSKQRQAAAMNNLRYSVSTDKKKYSLITGRLESTTGVEWSHLKENSFLLSDNFPNPFNPVTSIHYQVSSSTHVKLAVYDMLGREIAVLINSEQKPGIYTVEFNPRNYTGERLASGIYFYRITAGKFTQTKKMVFIK